MLLSLTIANYSSRLKFHANWLWAGDLTTVAWLEINEWYAMQKFIPFGLTIHMTTKEIQIIFKTKVLSVAHLYHAFKTTKGIVSAKRPQMVSGSKGSRCTVCESKTRKINNGSFCLFANFLSKFFSYNFKSSCPIKHFRFKKILEKSAILSAAAILIWDLKILRNEILKKRQNIFLFFGGVRYYLCRPTFSPWKYSCWCMCKKFLF